LEGNATPGDVRIYCEDGGTKDAGSGCLLAFVPCRGGNATISFFTEGAPFSAIEESKRGYRCITIDLRNADGGQSSGLRGIERAWDADDQLGRPGPGAAAASWRDT
jgi:hypothetical protein